MRLLWLPHVLEVAGCYVVREPGWETRGYELNSVEGIVCHHTATGTNWSDQSVINLLTNGRPDLKGPLAQVGLCRKGHWHIITSGRANHNGYGTWGNQSIGIEAFNSGTGEPWSNAMLMSWHKGCAAILKYLGYGIDHIMGHKETDPKRKIDPAGLDMNLFRSNVQTLMNPPIQLPPPSYIGTLEEDTVLATLAIATDASGNGWTDFAKPWTQFRGATAQGNNPPTQGYGNPTVTALQWNSNIRLSVTGGTPNGAVYVHVNLATV